MYLKYFNSLLHLLKQHFSKCKIDFYIYKLYYLVGIFYVLFIYVLQGYFGNWTKKEPLKFEELGMHNTVAPDDRRTWSGRPDRTDSGFSRIAPQTVTSLQEPI